MDSPLHVLAVQCKLLVSPIPRSREQHLCWSDGCLCRSRCSVVTKRLSGCRWDVGWSEGLMDAVEESGEFMRKS